MAQRRLTRHEQAVVQMFEAVADTMLRGQQRFGLCSALGDHYDVGGNGDDWAHADDMVFGYGVPHEGRLRGYFDVCISGAPDYPRADFALLMAEMVRTEGAAAWEVVA